MRPPQEDLRKGGLRALVGDEYKRQGALGSGPIKLLAVT
jgi:hypothetical protein